MGDTGSDHEDTVAGLLRAIGPRLRELRIASGATLAELAEALLLTPSVLSRIETGARPPTLDHLLALARHHDLSLDDLLGLPDRGDPRVRPRPVDREGLTLLPLTVRPGGIQAYKVLYPPASEWGEPRLRTHEGWQWLCVLAGSLRFVRAQGEQVLGPGDSAEHDTSRPHWLGSATDDGTEVVMLFSATGLRHAPTVTARLED